MIPAIIFLFIQAFTMHLLHHRYPEARPLDYIIFPFFLLSACITLSLSFLYHTLMNHSVVVSHLWLRLDYVGILALTLGDFVSGVRVGIYCDPPLRKVYWGMVRVSWSPLPLAGILPVVLLPLMPNEGPRLISVLHLPDINVRVRNRNTDYPPEVFPRPQISQASCCLFRNSWSFWFHSLGSRPHHLRFPSYVGRVRHAVLSPQGRYPRLSCLLLRYALPRVI